MDPNRLTRRSKLFEDAALGRIRELVQSVEPEFDVAPLRDPHLAEGVAKPIRGLVDLVVYVVCERPELGRTVAHIRYDGTTQSAYFLELNLTPTTVRGTTILQEIAARTPAADMVFRISSATLHRKRALVMVQALRGRPEVGMRLMYTRRGDFMVDAVRRTNKDEVYVIDLPQSASGLHPDEYLFAHAPR